MAVHLTAPEDAAAVLHWNPAVGLVEHDDQGDDQQADEGEEEHSDDVVAIQEAGGQEAGEADDDAGEDDQRDAVADAALGDQFTHPDQEHGAGGQGQYRSQRGHESVWSEPDGGEQAGLLQEHHLGEGLSDGDGNRTPVGDAVHLDATGFTFSGKVLQLRDNGRQQLHDDGRRDVREHTQGDDTHAAQRAAGEQVQEPEELVVVEQLLQGGRVEPRYGNMGDQPVEGQHRQGEKDLGPKVGQAERVDRRLHQAWPSTSCLCLSLNHGAPCPVLPNRVPRLELGYGSAGRFDLGPGRGGELVRGHGQRLLQFSVSHHLHRQLGAPDDAQLMQQLRRDLGVGLKPFLQRFQVHQRVVGLVAVVEPALHGQTLDQGHLSAFEAGSQAGTGAGFLTLHAAPGVAASAGGIASANPLAGSPRASGRRNFMFHHGGNRSLNYPAVIHLGRPVIRPARR